MKMSETDLEEKSIIILYIIYSYEELSRNHTHIIHIMYTYIRIER